MIIYSLKFIYLFPFSIWVNSDEIAKYVDQELDICDWKKIFMIYDQSLLFNDDHVSKIVMSQVQLTD